VTRQCSRGLDAWANVTKKEKDRKNKNNRMHVRRHTIAQWNMSNRAGIEGLIDQPIAHHVMGSPAHKSPDENSYKKKKPWHFLPRWVFGD
jgi:hypothetical protein